MMETSVLRKPCVLVVDDEVAMVRSLELLLRPVADVKKAYSVPEAEESLASHTKIDCVITDVSMPEESGLNLLEKMRKKSPETPVIIMTAFSSVPQAVEAMHRGAFEYVVKPFENQDMVEVVKRAIAKRGLSVGETKRMPTGWICLSAAMAEAMARLQKLAHASSSVLLVGESGVGKSRAARWLHDQGGQSKKDFLAVDGRAHEDDSPLAQKIPSRVGTLYVAEALSLPKRLQDRLYEILREGRVHVIASTAASPELQVDESFHSELLKELMSVTTKIPPLRDRKEDLEGLVSEILTKLAQRLKLPSLSMDSQAVERLKAYSFPGNVRELERIIERATLELKGHIIIEENLKFDDADLKGQLPFAIPVEDGWSKLDLLKENLERELIGRALKKFPEQSNTQIAEILGTTRRILELRMKLYKIREGFDE